MFGVYIGMAGRIILFGGEGLIENVRNVFELPFAANIKYLHKHL